MKIFEPWTFEMQDAEPFSGKNVEVTCMEGGIHHTYIGRLIIINQDKTKVGNEVLMNECIIKIKEYQ